ncbi:MAG: phosphate/phosphite/phosphonate ABC transporter substrate-binding protein [Anaerolineae bacterium]|nr:phosphate/phosphite/phosphonate ABC transporter substrate-binding protein [Anaerolineae bacterium]
MKRKLLSLLIVSLVVLSGVSLVSAQGELGSEDNPIQVYFVPSVEAQTITTGGEVMAQALKEATGLNFEVFVPTSYAATVEAMCAAPDSSMGFIPAAGYVIASNRCGVEVAAAAVRRGWPVYWAAYITRRDSGIHTFNDLAGKSWAYPDAGSTSGFVFPSVEFANAGIEPGERVEAGGHNQVVLAVYNGEADFGTTFYSPPVVPGGAWSIGDLPEPYDLTVDESYIGEDGNLYVGDVQILDARANVRETAPDVVDQVKIVRLSAPIPNDTLSFGPEFPEEMRTQIIDALIAFSETDAWAESIGSDDFYGWSSIAPITDATYDIVRGQFEVLGLTEADVFGDE